MTMIRTLFILSSLCCSLCYGQDIKDDSWKSYKPSTDTQEQEGLAVDTPDTIGIVGIMGIVNKRCPKAAGKVTIHEAPAITELVNAYNSGRHTMKGYRVQVFLGDRDAANKVRARFQARHPNTPVYLSYLAPNFRVRVGDLRDRAEADGLRYRLKDSYPGAYVVPDEIEWPRLE